MIENNKNLVYSQSQHLHLLEEIMSQQVIAFPRKLPFREFTWSLYFFTNDKKPTERLSFSKSYNYEHFDLCEYWTVNLLIKCHLLYPVSNEPWIKNNNFLVNFEKALEKNL
jgi:hypothetical protein